MDRLRSLRMELGKKQDEIADDFGFSTSTIQQYEAGKRGANAIRAVKKAAKYFGVSTDYLLGLTEIRNELSDADKRLAYRINRLGNAALIENLLGIIDEFEKVQNENQKHIR